MTTLKQVLAFFEQRQQPVFLPQVAKELGISQPILEDMIQYWVRKGRLREVANPCQTCGTCPILLAMPRRYELAIEENSNLYCACTRAQP